MTTDREKALRDALGRYGDHLARCHWRGGKDCNCGFHDAIHLAMQEPAPASAPSSCGAEKIVMEAAVREGCTPAHASRIARRASSDDFTDAEYTGAIERIYDHSLEVAAKLRSENEKMRAEIAALRAPASAPSCCWEDEPTVWMIRTGHGTHVRDTKPPETIPDMYTPLYARAHPCRCGELREAAQKALNYIENTESELGITLSSGDALRSAIAALRPAQDAEGWVLVPREITPEMRFAVWVDQYLTCGGSPEDAEELAKRRVDDPTQRAQDEAAYRAMLAASPPRTLEGE